MSGTVMIIGAGQAGFTLALTLRQKGFAGAIHLIGDEAEPPYERPPLSKAYLKGAADRDALQFRAPSFYAEKDIALHLGRHVLSIETEARLVHLDTGARMPYEHLALTTGARVRRLSCPGADLEGVRYLRSLADADALKQAIRPGRKIAVIGGGYIGLEAAASARALGAEVTVIEALDRLMARTASEDIAAAMLARHRAEGVELLLGRSVAAFEGEGGRLTALSLGDGTRIKADIALVGVGVLPNIELAAEAGLAVGRGIIVDAYGRTSVAGIHAAGDCAEYAHPCAPQPMVIESVQNAVDQAKAAASAILGEPQPYEAVPWFWSDQYDWKLQTIGMLAPGDRCVPRGDPASASFSVCHLREGRLVAVECLNRPRDYVQAKKPIIAGVMPDPARLEDPDFPLKDLL